MRTALTVCSAAALSAAGWATASWLLLVWAVDCIEDIERRIEARA